VRIEIADAGIVFGARVVFSGFSASIRPGEVTALVGPSGSGKSTLLAAMAGYQRLATGRIGYHDGDRVIPPNPELVAWVPQGSNALGTRSALDNVMIAPLSEGQSAAEAREIAASALDDVGLLDRADERVRRLSGGELQRVSFARALATSTPIIFADEPSASLDGANTELLGALLAGLRSRATIVVATHDPILIESAGAVVRLRPEHARAAG
jgi:putative ABC transport system ATP-binding protein